MIKRTFPDYSGALSQGPGKVVRVSGLMWLV